MDDKFQKKVHIYGSELNAYVDLGSQCTLIKESVATCVLDGREWRFEQLPCFRGFGNSTIQPVGACVVELLIDNIKFNVELIIVPDQFLSYDILIGQTVTEQPHIEIHKDNKHLLLKSKLPTNEKSIVLSICSNVNIYGDAMIKVKTNSDITGEVCINNSLRTKYTLVGGKIHIKNGRGYVHIANRKLKYFIIKSFFFLLTKLFS